MSPLLGGGGFQQYPGSFADYPVPLSRRTDWSFTGVIGGIPNRASIAATFNPGDSAAAINAAIGNAANAGKVIFLNAGTYTAATLNGTITLNSSNITLRGAGASQTTLKGAGILSIGNFSGGTPLGTAITGGGQKATFTITVASLTNLAVGTMIEIDRASDPNVCIIPPANEPGPPYTGRDMTQLNMITAISGNTLTVRNPWIYDFSTGSPTVKFYWPSITQLSGLENLQLDHASFTSTTVTWANADQCWMKGVQSCNSTGFHFEILATLNCEVRNCFIHDGATGPNNSGLDFQGDYRFGGNSHWRIENNIFNKNFPQIEVNQSSSGLYIGYNYAYASNSGNNDVSWTWDDAHAPFNMMNLYEGNIGEMFGGDGFFGGSAFATALRNYITGFNPAASASGDAIQMKRFSYYFNIVGNVIGSSNQAPTAYDVGCGVPNIYELGYPNIGNCGTDPFDNFFPPGQSFYPDAKVISTILRWGNYDYFNAAARFVASEIPAGVIVPPSHFIPNSYVYTSTPSWWKSGVAWPPIGPDVGGGNGDTSGHVNKIPAQLCWEQQNLLSGGSFDPVAFYGS